MGFIMFTFTEILVTIRLVNMNFLKTPLNCIDGQKYLFQTNEYPFQV